ncbi:hypothetical protein ACTFYF_13625, partial [Klebsiella pneumoniae]
QPPFAQNGTVVNLRMSTRFCTKGDGFQFLAKFAILPQNANSPKKEKAKEPPGTRQAGKGFEKMKIQPIVCRGAEAKPAAR